MKFNYPYMNESNDRHHFSSSHCLNHNCQCGENCKCTPFHQCQHDSIHIETYKRPGIYPQRQIISYNPPIEEVPYARYPKVSSQAVMGPNSHVIGDAYVDADVTIGWNNLIRADSSSPYYIGKKTNIQDFVLIHCHPAQHIEVDGMKYGVYISDEVSVLHHVQLHGPLFIGRNTLIGGGVSIYGASIGEDCVIMHGATIAGDVKIANGRFIEPGQRIWKQEQADQLATVPDKFENSNQEIVVHYYRLGKSYLQNTQLFI